MKKFLFLLVVILLLAPQVTSAKATTNSLYIVFEKTDSGIFPVSVQQVNMSAPLESIEREQIQSFFAGTPTRDGDFFSVILKAADGQIIYESFAEIPKWLRGEFDAGNGTIESYLFPLESSYFVVRVPNIAGSRLILGSTSFVPITQFETNVLSSDAQLFAPVPQGVHTQVAPAGNPGNRVDLLVMGDGYTLAEELDFIDDSDWVMDEFFDVTPADEYRNFVNVHYLYTPSDESGADHPPYNATCGQYDQSCCSDYSASYDPRAGTYVDTAYDARFCTNGIHRLLTVNGAKVYAAAAAVPDWDKILIIINDPVYGGAGGSYSTTSTHSAAPFVAQHEWGHSFARLADEYTSPYPGYPSCSDVSGWACQVNVTDVTNRSQIKWSPWIDPSTPIPTDNYDPAYMDVVGLFEGARYQQFGMFRSGQTCIMKALGFPYCDVPGQHYILRFYQGGWGIPWDGISLIEPGTTYPTSSTVDITFPAPLTLGADVLQPSGGPTVEVGWFVDGVQVPGANGDEFLFEPVLAQEGTAVEITMMAIDNTPMIHPAMAGGDNISSYSWYITIHAGDKVFLPLVNND